MARPKSKPTPTLAVDLNLEAWESQPPMMDAARAVADTLGMTFILTVLVNERPSANGTGKSLDFVEGYEHALRLLRHLLRGHRTDEAEPPPLPTYETDNITKELLWQTPQ